MAWPAPSLLRRPGIGNHFASAHQPSGRPVHMVTTPEHRARPTRRRSRRRRDEESRGRRHCGVREAAGSSSSASRRRPRHEEAEPARRRDRGAGLGDAAPPSPAKKPRVRSEVGLVRGCAWRFEPFSLEDDTAVGVPAAVAPTSPSSPAAPADNNCEGMVFAPDQPAPPKGGAGTAPSSSSAAPPAPTAGVLFACQVSLPPPPPPPLSSQAAPQPALLFTGAAAAAPPPIPASTSCPAWMKMIPSTSRQVIPPFPIVAPPPEQPAADVDELRRAKVQRYAGLIAKKQQETDERYRKLLRSGQAPPEPPKPAVVNKETLRRIAAARWRFREALARLERKAKEAALFVQMAPPEELRELGIDQDMERVVSPERPRDENGAPVVSPEHPYSPVEKLGFFLKVAE